MGDINISKKTYILIFFMTIAAMISFPYRWAKWRWYGNLRYQITAPRFLGF
jgi:hypothetical protein